MDARVTKSDRVCAIKATTKAIFTEYHSMPRGHYAAPLRCAEVSTQGCLLYLQKNSTISTLWIF